MASLRQDGRGNYVSRRKLPIDVRDEYGRLFGQRHEAKFFRPASTEKREAQRQFSEWSAGAQNSTSINRRAADKAQKFRCNDTQSEIGRIPNNLREDR
jgi:hypothetical protein